MVLAVATGASLTGVTLMVEVTAAERALPSLTCQEMVRLADVEVGVSDVELKETERRAASY